MGNRCTSCGQPLFEVIDGQTTREEILAFVASSPFYAYADLHTPEDDWAIPGQYCPNGCTGLVEIADGALCNVDFDAVEEELKKRTCKLVLQAVSVDIEKYKIYVDGYVEHALNRDKDADGCILLWVEPGEHRIVVRESEVHKSDRFETNTLHFSVEDNDAIRVSLSGNQASLELRQS